MPTKHTHMVRIAPATARRLKAYGVEQGGLTMDGSINVLLDAAGFPPEQLPDPFLWGGDQEGRERFEEMLAAATEAGDEALADFARKRLDQIAAALADPENIE